jgi:hypothetical protein
MAASDDDVRKKRPTRPEKAFNKLEAEEKAARNLANVIKEIKDSESKFLTPLAGYNTKFAGLLTYLDASHHVMSSLLKELSDGASALQKDYPAKFFDADGNISVEAYQDYLIKLSDLATKSASFNQVYLHDLEYHAKTYNRTVKNHNEKVSTSDVTYAVATPFQRGARHELLVKEMLKFSDPASKMHLNAKAISEILAEAGRQFNTEVLPNLRQRNNADVVKFMIFARAKLLLMPDDPRAVKMLAEMEKLIVKDVDHQLSFSDLNSVFTKRSSTILLKNRLDKLVESILKSPEMKQNRQSVTRGSETPSVKAPKAEADPIVETPKAETPKAEAPKAEAPKAEAPKAEAPKAEAPKAEADPIVETPKAETPKAETPKAEAKSSVWVNGVTPNASKPTTTERSSSNLSHEKLKTMIVSLYTTGWTPNALPDKSNATMPIEIKKEGDSFVITPDKLTTASSSVETFKAMLQAFNAVNPNKEPKITTSNPEAVKTWQQAYKETFPGKPVPTNLVEVKVAKEPVAPTPAAPEERTAPSPK